MPLGVLNNISAVYAENNLNQTQSSLQNVLTQLSSGSKINSGADDPAGLSIANGLAANSAALSQSSSNASEGAGFLQVADGALSQVTSLLTSAVTLATEAGGGTLSSSQLGAANQEYQDILTQIGTIGSTTEYNGISVFSSDQTTSALTWGNTGTPWTSSTTASSAAATAAAVQGSAIVAGGTKADATAPTVTQTYATAANIAWTKASDSSTLTSGPIAAGSQLAGTLAFTPTVSSGGTANAVSIDLSTITGSTLSDQATALATALNAGDGNSGHTDYTVTVGGTNSNELIIGLGSDATTDKITGFAAPSTTGTVAAPNGFTMSVTDGDLVSGTIDVTGSGSGTMPSNISLKDVNTADLQSVVDTDLNNGSKTPDYLVGYSNGTLSVSFTAQAATDHITGLVGAADTDSPLTAATPAAATIAFTSGDTLGGGFSITPTTNGSAGSAINVNLAGVSTAAPAGGHAGDAVVAAVNKALGSAASDYTVSYANNKLSISVNPANTDGLESVAIANGTTANSGPGALTQGTLVESNINIANTDMGSFTLTPTGTGSAITVSLKGLSPTGAGNAGLQAGIQAQLDAAASGDYVVSYDSTSDGTTGNLNIGVTSAGVAAGITGFSVAEPGTGAASQETPVSGGVNIYTSDGTSTGSQNYNVTVGTLGTSGVGTSASSYAMGTQITTSVSGATGTGGILSGAG